MADKDAYYFSHDSNARHDPKIVKMLCKYKYGYQWYFMIIEILRDQADYKYKMDEYYSNAIARDLHDDSTTIANFINDCINEFNLFDSDGQKFWSKSLLARMKIKEQKSKKYRENAKKRWNNSVSNGNAIAEQSLCIKGKERKVKESKDIYGGFEKLNNEPFIKAFTEWIAFRKEIKKALKPSTITKQLEFLNKQPEPITCINQSIQNGWQGLFEVKNGTKQKNGVFKPIGGVSSEQDKKYKTAN